MKTMPAPLYLVIDQGGQSSRALVFNGQGDMLSQASVAIETFRQDSGRVEHAADDIISSITSAIEQCTRNVEPGSIDCAGLACQRSSIVCWDRESGAALSPVLSWQDTRAGDSLIELSTQADEIHTLTGLFLSPHYGASKLRWCLDHLPEVRNAHKNGRLAMGPLSSFILFRLLEEQPILVDPVCASRTLLCNLESFDWDKTLLDLFGIPQSCLPRCVPNQFNYGHLQVGSCAIPLKVSTGDQAAALFMSGPPDDETVYINIGTGAFLQRVLGKVPLAIPKLLSSVVWRSNSAISYVLEGTVNGAASALQKISHELNINDQQQRELFDRGLLALEKPLLFLNGVSGVGSPYWRSEFDSRFVGEGNTLEKLTAVLESIVFLIQANLDEMEKYIDAPGRIVVSGGLSAMTGLCQRLASLSGLPVERSDNQEATALGLAWLLSRPAEFVDGEMTRFKPQPNPVLKKHYEQWRFYMSEGLEDTEKVTR